MSSVKYIDSYHGMHLNIFLVIFNRIAYLICWEPETSEFGFMCPCCMFSSHREKMANAVDFAQKDNLFDGKVRWCCHKEHTDYGDHLREHDAPLKPELFCSGDANADLTEMKSLIHEEAMRQVASGAIRLRTRAE